MDGERGYEAGMKQGRRIRNMVAELMELMELMKVAIHGECEDGTRKKQSSSLIVRRYR